MSDLSFRLPKAQTGDIYGMVLAFLFSSVPFIDHISPSCTVTYLQYCPVFSLALTTQLLYWTFPEKPQPIKNTNIYAASSGIPSNHKTIGRAFTYSQLADIKFLKVLDKLLSVMRYPIPLHKLNL